MTVKIENIETMCANTKDYCVASPLLYEGNHIYLSALYIAWLING